MPHQICLTESEILDGNIGGCLACGCVVNRIESDAENVECEECGAHAVCGSMILLIMGAVDIEDGELYEVM